MHYKIIHSSQSFKANIIQSQIKINKQEFVVYIIKSRKLTLQEKAYRKKSIANNFNQKQWDQARLNGMNGSSFTINIMMKRSDT